jgi:hypothetical protein
MRRLQRKNLFDYTWKKSGAIYVGRPTRWGNPFKIDENYGHTREHVLELYKNWLYNQVSMEPHFLDELRGKDLVCWCPLDVPCHADILLEWANRELVK